MTRRISNRSPVILAVVLAALVAALLSVAPADVAFAGGEEQGTPGPDGESGDDGDESSSDDDDI